jgi:hypothetical protein
MIRNFAQVKVCDETHKLLKKIKQEQGIPMTEAIRVAVREKYGKKNINRPTDN